MARYKELTCHPTWAIFTNIWCLPLKMTCRLSYKLGSTAWTLTGWTLADSFMHFERSYLSVVLDSETAHCRQRDGEPRALIQMDIWKTSCGELWEKFRKGISGKDSSFIPNVQPVLTSLTPRMCSRPVHGSVSPKNRILGDRRTKRLNVVVRENAWNKYCSWTAGVIFFAFERRSEFTRNLFFW